MQREREQVNGVLTKFRVYYFYERLERKKKPKGKGREKKS